MFCGEGGACDSVCMPGIAAVSVDSACQGTERTRAPEESHLSGGSESRMVANLAQPRDHGQRLCAFRTRVHNRSSQRQRVAAAAAVRVTVELQAVGRKLRGGGPAEDDDRGTRRQEALVDGSRTAQHEGRNAALQLSGSRSCDVSLFRICIGIMGCLDGAHKDSLKHCWWAEEARIDERHHRIKPAAVACMLHTPLVLIVVGC